MALVGRFEVTRTVLWKEIGLTSIPCFGRCGLGVEFVSQVVTGSGVIIIIQGNWIR